MTTRDGRTFSRHRHAKAAARRLGCGLLTSLTPGTRNATPRAQHGGAPSADGRQEPTQPNTDRPYHIADTHSRHRAHLHEVGRAIRNTDGVQTGLLDQAVELADNLSAAIGTKVQHASHWSYWVSFLSALGEDVDAFGTHPHASNNARRQAQQREMVTLERFMSHVVFKPMRRGKNHNTTSYARKVITSVREEYRRTYGRSIGLPGPEFNRTLAHLEKGLGKVAPSQTTPRLPVLQYHLRAVRRTLDLPNSQMDRVLWALWCTQFQGVLRAGDLIRPSPEESRNWDPNIDSHRGRVTFQRIRGEPHADGKMRMTMALKPHKTDQTGEKRFVKSFVVLEDPLVLSAGDAIHSMLRHDPVAGDQTNVPLFRDPHTGREITYERAASRFKEALSSAGYPELATGLHCLRKGGATAYCETAGEEIAGYMGLWTSDARLHYFHASSARLERAGMTVANENGSELAIRPGPLGTYAGRGGH